MYSHAIAEVLCTRSCRGMHSLAMGCLLMEVIHDSLSTYSMCSPLLELHCRMTNVQETQNYCWGGWGGCHRSYLSQFRCLGFHQSPLGLYAFMVPVGLAVALT